MTTILEAQRRTALRELPKNLTIEQVADRLDIGYATAAVLVRNNNYKTKNRKQFFWEQFFAKLEDKEPLTLDEIMNLANCSRATACKRAKEFGYETKRKTREQEDQYDWSNVDWSRPNCEIAEQVGCSRWGVTLKRRSLGKANVAKKVHTGPRIPITTAINNLASEFAEQANGLLDYNDWADICRDPENKELLDTRRMRVRSVLPDYVEYTKPIDPHAVPDMDMRLANCDLAEIWEIRETTVGWERLRLDKFQPMYEGRQPQRMEDDAYLKLLDDERHRRVNHTREARDFIVCRKALLADMRERWAVLLADAKKAQG